MGTMKEKERKINVPQPPIVQKIHSNNDKVRLTKNQLTADRQRSGEDTFTIGDISKRQSFTSKNTGQKSGAKQDLERELKGDVDVNVEDGEKEWNPDEDKEVSMSDE